MQLTRQGAHLVLLVVAVAAFAALVRSWTLAAAIVPLALVLGAAASASLLPRGPLRAIASVEPPLALAGDPARLDLLLERDAGAGFAEIVVAPHPFVEVEPKEAVLLARVTRQRPARLSCALQLPVRGRFPPGELRVRERSIASLFAEERVLPLPTNLVVMPRWESVPALRPRRDPRRRVMGPVSAGRVGQGGEFFGLRRYHPGDPMDAVNWRKTAKLGRPIVNEHESEVPATLVIALDARASNQVGAGYHSTHEAGIRAAASLSQAAVKARQRVGLVVLGRRMEWLHPATGARQHERIVERLLDVPAAGDLDLGAHLETLPVPVLPHAATLLLVTSANDDARLPGGLRRLIGRASRVLVVSPDPLCAEQATPGMLPEDIAAARALAATRARTIGTLRSAGAEVADWDPREPLALALARAGVR